MHSDLLTLSRSLGIFRCHDGDGGKKRCLQSDFAFLETSAWLFKLSHFIKHWQVSWSWICKNHLHVQKEKETFVVVYFCSPWNLKFAMQWRQKNTPKSVMTWMPTILWFLILANNFLCFWSRAKKNQAWFLTDKEKLDTSGL